MRKNQILRQILGRTLTFVSRSMFKPIDLKLKTLVVLDFNDHLCSFLCWGSRIGVVLSRHLDRSKRKVQRCRSLVTSRYKLF